MIQPSDTGKAAVNKTDIPVLCNYINGKWVEAATGCVTDQRDPADLSVVTCRFQQSGREDARAAIAAAEDALPAWSALTAPKRAEFLVRAQAVIVRCQEEIAASITQENGKTIAESRVEVAAAIKEMDWLIGEGRRLYGETIPVERDGVFAHSIRQPLGVVSVISPWNFPFNVVCRKCVPALMGGNTVVLKPASLTPRTAAYFVEAMDEAELPRGVLNCITGPGSTAGDELVVNPAIRAISFTGSTPDMVIARMLERSNVILVTKGVSAAEATAMGLEHASDPAAALAPESTCFTRRPR
jgi:acyl-CoA reductase-like NAD-dependent aldehyde dehydrogenase